MNFFKGLGRKITEGIREKGFDLQEVWDNLLRNLNPYFHFFILSVNFDYLEELGINVYGSIPPFLENWVWGENLDWVSHKDYNGEKKWFSMKVGKE